MDTVKSFLDFILVLVTQFAGGPGRPENNLVRFGLAAGLLAALLRVAWVRQRNYDLPRERRLVWGFGLALARELLMFVFTVLQIIGWQDLGTAYSPVFAPLERALAVAAVVMIAGAFLHYILDDDRLSARYLRVGLGASAVLYAVSAGWWVFYAPAHAGASFRQTWASWLYRGLVLVLLLLALFWVARRRGWLRNTVMVALSLFLLDELLMVCSFAGAERYNRIFCPLSHACHLLAIGLLGYVYVREQSAERRRAQEELIALNAIATTISHELDLDRMLKAILHKVLEVVDAQAGWIRLADQETRALLLAAHCPPLDERAPWTQAQVLETEIAEQVYRSHTSIVLVLEYDIERTRGQVAASSSPLALIAVPVQSRDTVVGALVVLSHAPRRPDEHKVELLTSIGHQVGVAVENVWLVEEVSQAEIWKELNRLRSELIANVSHEVRTPLGLIRLACTSLLATDVEFTPEIEREFLQGIDEETTRLESIVNSLLDLSQIESGGMRLNRQPVGVAQLVQEVTKGIQAQSSAHEIVYDVPEALVANVDRGRIEQVLRNLLTNAVKYSPDGGEIRVQAYEDEGQLYLLVRDQGIGLSPQDRERVFERFYRAENKVTQTQSGVGLGLAVCKHIVEAHGGQIWVESKLGRGSTFYVALPNVPSGMVLSEGMVLAEGIDILGFEGQDALGSEG